MYLVPIFSGNPAFGTALWPRSNSKSRTCLKRPVWVRGVDTWHCTFYDSMYETMHFKQREMVKLSLSYRYVEYLIGTPVDSTCLPQEAGEIWYLYISKFKTILTRGARPALPGFYRACHVPWHNRPIGHTPHCPGRRGPERWLLVY